jgi:hypothetical protein
MRTIKTATALVLSATPAFAAPHFVDNSGIVVWTFLGFCALIVVAQLIPALAMIVSSCKAFAKHDVVVAA